MFLVRYGTYVVGTLLAMVLALAYFEGCKTPTRTLMVLRGGFGKVRHCPVSALDHPCLQEFIREQSGSCGKTLLVGGTTVAPETLASLSADITRVDLSQLETLSRDGYRCVLISNEFWKTPDPAALLEVLHRRMSVDGVVYIHFDQQVEHEYVLKLKPLAVHTLLHSTGFSTIYIGKNTYVAVKR